MSGEDKLDTTCPDCGKSMDLVHCPLCGQGLFVQDIGVPNQTDSRVVLCQKCGWKWFSSFDAAWGDANNKHLLRVARAKAVAEKDPGDGP